MQEVIKPNVLEKENIETVTSKRKVKHIKRSSKPKEETIVREFDEFDIYKRKPYKTKYELL
jgi:hypothetical protein